MRDSRRRDPDQASRTCLNRSAPLVLPRSVAREATRALDRAKARAIARADAFEKWACENARDVLRHVVVNLATGGVERG